MKWLTVKGTNSSLKQDKPPSFSIETQNRFTLFDEFCQDDQGQGMQDDPIVISSDDSDDGSVDKKVNDTNRCNNFQPFVRDNDQSEFEVSDCDKQECSSPMPKPINEPIYASKLPYDIDGDTEYRLPYDCTKRMKSSVDGRPWKTWVTTSRKGLAGIRRIAHCRGSYKCCNADCSYRKQYKQTANRTQFEKEAGETICKCCGILALHVNCHASKVWEFPQNSKYVTIIHRGKHTCVPIPKQDSSSLKSTFLENPNLRPRQAAFQCAVSALKAGKPWEEVIDVTDRFINTNLVKNVKQKVRQEMHPCGVNFEAIGQLKCKVNDRDPYYIYSVNDRKLNQSASYVFKTSKVQIKLALSMDKDADGVLSTEYCFMDVKHNRCVGFKSMYTIPCCEGYLH